MISPAFFTDPDVGELSALAALLFVGLWTIADREGRLDGDERRLKALVFPYRVVDTEALLVELEAKDMIRRYDDVSGRPFLWIRNFTKHQRPHPKEPESVIPPCPDTAMKKRGKPWQKTAKPSESGSLDSCIRNLDSGSSESGATLPLVAVAPPKSTAMRADVFPAGFVEFWQVYPRRTAKADAMKAWRKLNPSVQVQAAILEALSWQAHREEWARDGGQFIPHPATWLNRGQWQDERPKSTPFVGDAGRQTYANGRLALAKIQES